MAYSTRERVAAEVRAEMARQRRTQTELAEHLDMSQQAVSRRMTGELAWDVDEITDIADWLGVPLAALMAEAGAA